MTLTRLDIDVPVARLTRLAQIAEAEKPPAWPFDIKPEFVAGSCVRFWHRGQTVATAEADQLQIPKGTRDPWWIWLRQFEWAGSTC